MATEPQKNISYDVTAADRRRKVIRVGLTAVVIVVTAVAVLYVVMSSDKKPTSARPNSIRVASSTLITKDGSTEPKVVLSLYEDFLCPICRAFEQKYGPTINQLIDDGAIAADYYMVAILDRRQNQNYSSRASAAAYCMADEDTTTDKQAFRRFHAALYAQQPSETGPEFPTNADLIETARQAGLISTIPDCINTGVYINLSTGLGAATNVTATPTVRINGQNYQYSTPEDLVTTIRAISG